MQLHYFLEILNRIKKEEVDLINASLYRHISEEKSLTFHWCNYVVKSVHVNTILTLTRKQKRNYTPLLKNRNDSIIMQLFEVQFHYQFNINNVSL